MAEQTISESQRKMRDLTAENMVEEEPVEEIQQPSVPSQIPSSLLEGQKIVAGDIQNLLKQQRAGREQLAGLGELSPETKALQEQLASKQEEITGLQATAREQIAGVEGQGRGMLLSSVRGEQAKLQQQAELKLTRLAGEEKNLLTRLGFAKEAQEYKRRSIETLLSYNKQDLDLQFKMQDRIESNIADYQKKLEKQDEIVRGQIEDIVDTYSRNGLDFNDLPGEDRAYLIDEANRLNIPLNMIQYGLAAAKDKYTYDRMVQEKKDALSMASTQLSMSRTQQLMGETARKAQEEGYASGIPGIQVKEKSRFLSEVNVGINDLKEGFSWGQVWNKMHAAYPDVPNEVLDTMLGGGIEETQAYDELGQPISSMDTKQTPWGWARGGAAKEFKGDKPLTNQQKESIIWIWTNTDEYANMSQSERDAKIRSYGLNPKIFRSY